MKTAKTFAFMKLRVPSEALTEPSQIKKHFEATKSLMTALGGLLNEKPGSAISLELAIKNGQIAYIIAAPEELHQEVMQHLYAAHPAADLEELDEWAMFDLPGEVSVAGVQFAPSTGNIRDTEFGGADPLQPALEALSAASGNERLCLQLLLTGAASRPNIVLRAANGLGGLVLESLDAAIRGPSQKDHKSTAATTAEEDDDKTKTAVMRANLRVIALAQTPAAAEKLARQAASAYHQFAVPGKTTARYQKPRQMETWLEAALLRQSHAKTSFLLTAAEATNLYHAPLRPRAFGKLEVIASTQLPLPENRSDEGITIGFGAYRGSFKPIRLHPDDRLRHTYLIGQTGTGKSTLFQSAILQDMAAGEGCCFIDPHGEAIDWLLPRIPAHRAKDVILFDSSDPDALLGLNLLEWRTPHERDLLIQELILLFYKLFDPQRTGIIGPQFEHWLRNAALTITEPSVRGAITDIPRLFTDQQFQKTVLAHANHWAVKDFWYNQMAQTADFHKSEMLNYFTSKFGGFLSNTVMYRILSARSSAFDMRTLMDRRKILLVNLSKGRLGSLNSQLLGALIVAKIQMAALSRADVAPDQRPPFYVYIDEFQNIVTDSFASMLSEIRKYGVALHLAHQYADQLPENIRASITGNVGTLMAFRLGHTDAMWLKDHFAPLTPDDLTGIPPYHYHLRTLAGGQLTTPFTVQAPRLRTAPRPQLEHELRTRIREYVAAINTT